jgi:hypothetical protein
MTISRNVVYNTGPDAKMDAKMDAKTPFAAGPLVPIFLLEF